jgi:hypothetical protein
MQTVMEILKIRLKVAPISFPRDTVNPWRSVTLQGVIASLQERWRYVVK